MAREPHEQEHREQRRDIDHQLHFGRPFGIADQRVQQAAEQAAFRQQPRRIPDRAVERDQHAGIVEELHRLRRHAGGEQRDQPARHREDVAGRDRQQAEIGQRR